MSKLHTWTLSTWSWELEDCLCSLISVCLGNMECVDQTLSTHTFSNLLLGLLLKLWLILFVWDGDIQTCFSIIWELMLRRQLKPLNSCNIILSRNMRRYHDPMQIEFIRHHSALAQWVTCVLTLLVYTEAVLTSLICWSLQCSSQF